MREFQVHVSAFYEMLTSCESCEQREFYCLLEDTFVCESCLP